MEYRVFRNPEPRTMDDGRSKPFGRRQGLAEAVADRLTAGRLIKALLFGLGIGALGLLLAPAL